MRTVANYAAELKMPAQALLEQLRKAGIHKKDGSERLTDADVSKLLRYLVGQRPPPAKKKVLVRLESKGEVGVTKPSEEEPTPPLRHGKDRVVQPRPMRASEGAQPRAASIEAPYRLPPRVNPAHSYAKRKAVTPTKVAPSTREPVTPSDPLGRGRTPCTCNGENERCYKCDGKGWIASEPIAIAKVKMPPVLRQLSVFAPTPVLTLAASEIKQAPKPKALPKPSPTKVKPKQVEQPRADKPPYGHNSSRRMMTVTRAEAELKGWLKSAPQAVRVSTAEKFCVTLSHKNSVVGIQPIREKAAGQHLTPSKKNKASQRKKHSASAKPSNQKQKPTLRNPAMSDALAEAHERLAQERNERALDATKDYWRLRDNNGSFGSHPSHDDFDE